MSAAAKASTTSGATGSRATESAREPATALQTFAAQHRSELPEAPMLSALRDEHRHLASVLALLSDHLNAVERGELVNTHVIYEIMDYMVTWPDRFHHPREDLIYDYAADVDHGLRDDRRRLEQEHDAMARQGRDLLQCVEDWRAGEVDGSELVRLGREYVQRSYAHMAFEEQQVFPAIDEVLTRDEWRELAADEQLRPMRDPVFGRRVSREFRNMARKLRRSLRRGVERRAVSDWVSVEALLEGYEVLSMAAQSGRSATADQLRTGLREAVYITLDAPLKAPLLCAANNTRLTLEWAQEMQAIYRDAAVDLLRVNRERKDRLRLLRRAGRP
jgi:hemerythrin-like domain-containing protein